MNNFKKETNPISKISYGMKKYLLFSIILTVLLSGSAYAEVSSSTGVRERVSQLKQKITEVKQTAAAEKVKIKAELASTTANLKNAVKGLKQELKTTAEIRIGKKLDVQKSKVADAFEKTIQNLKDLVTRVESRMSKMESSGTDVSKFKSLLEIAKIKLTLAETELSTLENLLTQNIPTATSTKKTERKALLQNIKTQSEKIKSAIKVAHQSIIDVVNSLKPGLTRKEGNATTTTSTTTSTGTNSSTSN